jgi:hypothetical protein
VLSVTNQEEIVEFCRKEGLVILADEVCTNGVFVWDYSDYNPKQTGSKSLKCSLFCIIESHIHINFVKKKKKKGYILS